MAAGDAKDGQGVAPDIASAGFKAAMALSEEKFRWVALAIYKQEMSYGKEFQYVKYACYKFLLDDQNKIEKDMREQIISVSNAKDGLCMGNHIERNIGRVKGDDQGLQRKN